MSTLVANVDFVYLVLLGFAVVLITRYVLIRGIEQTSDAWRVPRKIQGQVLGYATSAPELVGTVATAAKGLLGAGLWNVAASNIINLGLFVAASLYYGRTRALFQRKFSDEIGFAIGAIGFPLVLAVREDWARTPWTALALFGFFLSYLAADRYLNPKTGSETDEAQPKGEGGYRGIALIVLGLVGIAVTGHFLGIVAENIVTRIGVPEWAVGWILGVLTSLPELTSFFAVFAAARAQDGDDDCQQNLDNLAASNMSNVGLVYPIGIMVFLFAVS